MNAVSQMMMPKALSIWVICDDELACVASFHPQNYTGIKGKAYQLRGMATTRKI
jgi:hypothetical protein